MSLHTLANHMSAHGRGPDSTLVHMSPREVQGLQALAMRHGGSLTINPQTGLPEAGILENLLPAIAGFALNAFAPGIGGAVGSALGLTGGMASAVGTGLIVGGVTGLASGSLEKGLMAGLGGYGGASLGSSVLSAGDAALAGPPVSASNLPNAAQASPIGTVDRLQAGMGVLGGAPMDALKNNALNIGLASAPVFMDSFGGDDKEETAAPKRQSGNLYVYGKDPLTGKSVVQKTYSGDEVKNAPPVVFGNAHGGLMQHYDEGGPVEKKKLEPVKFSSATEAVDANGNPITPATEKTISDSQRAQDYLLGKPGATNPFLFYSKGPAAAALSTAPVAALSTAGISSLMPESVGGGRGIGFEAQQIKNDQDAWKNLSDDEKTEYYINNPNMLTVQEFLTDKFPFKTAEWERANKINLAARGAIHARSLNAPIQLEPTPIQTPKQAEFNRFNFGIPLNQPPGAIFDIDDFGENPDGSPSYVKLDGEPTGSEPSGPQGYQGGYNPGTGYTEVVVGDPTPSPTTNTANLSLSKTAEQLAIESAAEVREKQKLATESAERVAAAQAEIDQHDAIIAEAEAASDARIAAFDASRKGSRGGGGGYGGDGGGGSQFGGGLSNQSSETRSALRDASGYGGGVARGGLLDSRYAYGGITALAQGGYNLGSYSDGGRLLRGPGDGVSDSIPAVIGRKQPARLADGEFVIPARIVSELGNGSTEAGARKLYAMMDRVQKARSKTVGKNKVAANSRADKYLPV